MKVKLINVADYDLKENGKTSDIPFNSFVNLCGGLCGLTIGESANLPKVRLFKTIGEFVSLSKEEIDEIDQEEKIRVLPNGQFLVFLKAKSNQKENNTESEDNATTDTEENTAK